MAIDTVKDRGIVAAATDEPIRMIEIYHGKDEQWAGWYNLLINNEEGTPIAGPLNPEQAAPLLVLLDAVEERDALKEALRHIKAMCSQRNYSQDNKIAMTLDMVAQALSQSNQEPKESRDE